MVGLVLHADFALVKFLRNFALGKTLFGQPAGQRMGTHCADCNAQKSRHRS